MQHGLQIAKKSSQLLYELNGVQVRANGPVQKKMIFHEDCQGASHYAQIITQGSKKLFWLLFAAERNLKHKLSS